MKKTLINRLLSCAIILASPQAFSADWNSLYPFNDVGPSAAVINGAAQDSSGALWTVGTDANSGGTTRGIVRKSTDIGVTWSLLANIGADFRSINAITADLSGDVFVGGQDASGQNGLIKESSDGGKTWKLAFNGAFSVNAIEVDTGGRIFASGFDNDEDYLIYLSSDNGLTWNQVDANDQLDFSGPMAIAIDSADNVYVMINSGANSCCCCCCCCSVSSGKKKGGTGSSQNEMMIRESKDHGMTWATASQTNATGNAMTADILGNVYISGVNDAGVGFLLKSSDAGSTFNSSVLNALVSITADAKGTLYGSGLTGLIQQSTDGGVSFTTLFTPTDSSNPIFKACLIDAVGNLYFAGSNSNLTNGQAFVNQSLDQGVSWKNSDTFSIEGPLVSHALVSAFDSSDNLFVAGTVGGEWVLRESKDKGKSWTTVDHLNPGSKGTVHAFAFGASGEIYVVGQDQGNWIVRKSLDHGVTWVTVDSVLGGAAMLIAASGSSIEVVGTDTNGNWNLRTSADAGVTWVQAAVASANAYQFSSLVADRSGNLYLAGIEGGGARASVLKSTSAGLVWSEVGYLSGIQNAPLADIQLMNIEGTLYFLGVSNQSVVISQSRNQAQSWSDPAPVLLSGAVPANLFISFTYDDEVMVTTDQCESVVGTLDGGTWSLASDPSATFTCAQVSLDRGGNIFSVGSTKNAVSQWSVMQLQD